MNKTKISYLTHTWNPVKMRCTPVSAGCANCWHLAMAKRLAGNPKIDRDAQRAYLGLDPCINYKELEAPLRLKKPARIGVQFMGDLFHKEISFEVIEKIFMKMTSGKHTFFVLTKRPDRMKAFIQWMLKEETRWMLNTWGNVWLGVSVEDQKTADERIPILLQIPAAKRFVSMEPMLGLVKLHNRWLTQFIGKGITDDNFLDWVICGGETGPNARPMHPDWVRSVVQQCRSAGVPVFVKQLSGKDAKDMDKWPEDLRIREIPDA